MNTRHKTRVNYVVRFTEQIKRDLNILKSVKIGIKINIIISKCLMGRGFNYRLVQRLICVNMPLKTEKLVKVSVSVFKNAQSMNIEIPMLISFYYIYFRCLNTEAILNLMLQYFDDFINEFLLLKVTIQFLNSIFLSKLLIKMYRNFRNVFKGSLSQIKGKFLISFSEGFKFLWYFQSIQAIMFYKRKIQKLLGYNRKKQKQLWNSKI